MPMHYYKDSEGTMIRIASRYRPSQKNIPKSGTWIVEEWYEDEWIMPVFPEIKWVTLRKMEYLGKVLHKGELIMNKEPNIFPTRSIKCPHCGKNLDTASCIAGEVVAPKFGDISVCFGCGGLLQFDEKLALTKLDSDIDALDLDEESKKAIAGMVMVVKNKNTYMS